MNKSAKISFCLLFSNFLKLHAAIEDDKLQQTCLKFCVIWSKTDSKNWVTAKTSSILKLAFELEKIVLQIQLPRHLKTGLGLLMSSQTIVRTSGCFGLERFIIYYYYYYRTIGRTEQFSEYKVEDRILRLNQQVKYSSSFVCYSKHSAFKTLTVIN